MTIDTVIPGKIHSGKVKKEFGIDPALETAIQSIREANGPDCVVCGFDSNIQDPCLCLLESSNGGIGVLSKHAPDNDVCYGIVRTGFTLDDAGAIHPNTEKYVFIMWRPDTIPIRRKMMIGVAEGRIKKLFSPFHATLEAESKNELTQESIKNLLDTLCMKSNNSAFRNISLQVKETVKNEKRSFLPTGTAADTMGLTKMKGANVVFDDFDGLQNILKVIRDNSEDLTWVLYHYSDHQTLSLHAKGCNGVDEMMNNVEPDNVAYGFFRIVEKFDMSFTIKFCFIVWQPESISPMKKCRISTHQGVVREAFRPYQFNFFATNKDEINESVVLTHIGDITGTRSHVTDRKADVKENLYERKMLGGVQSSTQELSFVDKELFDSALLKIRDDNCNCDWILAGFNGMKLALRDAGTGGIDFLKAKMNDETNCLQYALIRLEEKIDDSITTKFCFIKYHPDDVLPSIKGRVGVLMGAISSAFEPFHCAIFVTDITDITYEVVLQAVSNLRGRNS